MANPIISFDGRICIIDTYKSDIFDKSDRILDDLVALDEDMTKILHFFETACRNVLKGDEDFPQVLASTPLFSLTWNGWNVVLYFQRFRPKMQL